MDDLVTWLGEQLDEDAELAAAARVTPGPNQPNLVADQWWTQTALMSRSFTYNEAAFVCSWDPARVLAEVEAKRAILGFIRTNVIEGVYGEPTPMGDSTAEYLLRALALPYRDRPGYRPEWAPQP